MVFTLCECSYRRSIPKGPCWRPFLPNHLSFLWWLWTFSKTVVNFAFRFLNVGHHRNKYQSSKDRLPLASMDENAMDANMDELLDLCSGQFASQNKCPPNTYHGKKQNMEELLNLCSGKFASQSKLWILLLIARAGVAHTTFSRLLLNSTPRIWWSNQRERG